MARINIEDDVESQDEFWALMEIVKDRDRALGMLLRFFRLAQHHYGRREPIPKEEIALKGLEAMVASGWAIPDNDGYMAKGAEKEFAWYRQRVDSSSAGGRARSAGPRNDAGQYTAAPRDPAGIQPDTTRGQPASSPLSLSPSLTQRHSVRAKTAVAVSPSQESPGRVLISKYVDAFRRRYGEKTRPEITGKTAGQVGALLKSIPLARAIQLIQVYLQMDDPWFETKHHDFGTFVENLTKVGVALDTGKAPGGVDWSKVFGSANGPG